MRLLIDENVHPVVVQRLQAEGHAVEWIAHSAAGSSDRDILERSDIGALILVTYDRDFGDLIFNRGFPAPRSIIYCRLGRADPRHATERIAAVLAKGLPDRHIVSIGRDDERLRPFPDGASNA